MQPPNFAGLRPQSRLDASVRRSPPQKKGPKRNLSFSINFSYFNYRKNIEERKMRKIKFAQKQQRSLRNKQKRTGTENDCSPRKIMEKRELDDRLKNKEQLAYLETLIKPRNHSRVKIEKKSQSLEPEHHPTRCSN